MTSPIVVALNGEVTLREDGSFLGWITQWSRDDWRCDLEDGFDVAHARTMREEG